MCFFQDMLSKLLVLDIGFSWTTLKINVALLPLFFSLPELKIWGYVGSIENSKTTYKNLTSVSSWCCVYTTFSSIKTQNEYQRNSGYTVDMLSLFPFFFTTKAFFCVVSEMKRVYLGISDLLDFRIQQMFSCWRLFVLFLFLWYSVNALVLICIMNVYASYYNTESYRRPQLSLGM